MVYNVISGLSVCDQVRNRLTIETRVDIWCYKQAVHKVHRKGES